MKYCIVCFDFNSSNIKRQPWKFIYEFSKGLVRNGNNVTIISNRTNKTLMLPEDEEFKILYIDRLHFVFLWSKSLIEMLRTENPDVVLMLIGVTSTLRPAIKIDKPVVGIFTSPLYSLNDILDLGAKEILRHSRILSIHFAGALIPDFLKRKALRSFEKLVVLSSANKNHLCRIGIEQSRIIVLPHAIELKDLQIPKREEVIIFEKKSNPSALPVILYFGSPLTLRGTDLLINAFAETNKNHASKLILLSRIEDNSLLSDDNYLRKLVQKHGISNSVEIITGNLKKSELLKYVAMARLICLPFKFVISDVPVVVIESMIMGKPIISTNVDGIPELLAGRGMLVEPNDAKSLAKCLLDGLNNRAFSESLGNRAREYMVNCHPDWDSVANIFTEEIDLQKKGKHQDPNRQSL